MTSEQTEYYGEYAEAILKVRQIVLAELERILESVSRDPEQAPFEHLISRIKGVESAKEKLRRKGYGEDASAAVERLNDIIGIRVVTHFIGDIYQILEMISGDGLWRVEAVKDYIAAPKANGYRSLHVILSLPLEGCEGRCGVELQLRTIAMDCWAALEHQIRYKKDVKSTALISAELKRCADEMASADLTMQTIRDVLKGN